MVVGPVVLLVLVRVTDVLLDLLSVGDGVLRSGNKTSEEIYDW